MKKSLLTSAIILIGTIVIAGNFNSNEKKDNANLLGSAIVNSLDTVVFDLTQAVINGSSVEFPVSILSDDTVYALDFSLKYNHANLLYDTILNLTSHIQEVSYYNPNDSTIRFSSNSFTRYGNAVSLVSIRFTMLSTQIIGSDLNTIKSYLNGDACSIKLISTPVNIGISDTNNNDTRVSIYPNPAKKMVNIESTKNATIELFDVNGRQVVFQAKINANERREINSESIANGIYIMKIYGEDFLSIKKVVIDK